MAFTFGPDGSFPRSAVLLTAAVMVNISLWTYYRRPTKEIATLALLMWTVNLMHRLLDERRIGRIVALTAVAAVLTAYVSLMRYTVVTLTVGFGLAAAWLAWQRTFGWSRADHHVGAVGLVTCRHSWPAGSTMTALTGREASISAK